MPSPTWWRQLLLDIDQGVTRLAWRSGVIHSTATRDTRDVRVVRVVRVVGIVGIVGVVGARSRRSEFDAHFALRTSHFVHDRKLGACCDDGH